MNNERLSIDSDKITIISPSSVKPIPMTNMSNVSMSGPPKIMPMSNFPMMHISYLPNMPRGFILQSPMK
jgi:hypothetical protein